HPPTSTLFPYTTLFRSELMQLDDALANDVRRDAQLLRQLILLIVLVRQELVQRRIERADRHRPALHGLKDAFEIAPLIRQQLVRSEEHTSELQSRGHLV